MSLSKSIPIIDLASLDRGDYDGNVHLSQQFFHAYSTAGFSYIVNHGIDQQCIDKVFAASRAFHQLPLEEKLSISLDQNHRGFIPINTSTDVNSTLAEVTKPNQSESFMMMREDGPCSAAVKSQAFLAGPNQWPNLAGFQATVTGYHEKMLGLGKSLMGLAASALSTDPEQLLKNFAPPTSWLRLLYYPEQPAQSAADLYGSAPHTDFGCLTMLAQDYVGGLQVKSTDGHWIDVPNIENSFVVNVGDMLHRWSNGLLKSTPHRVINQSGAERYSIPFFYDPYVDTIISPLESCIENRGANYFTPIHFGDFLKSELKASYMQHQIKDADP